MNLISIKKKYFVFGIIALTAIALLITVRLAQQRQANQSKASASTTLSLIASPTSAKVGDTIAVTVRVDPGKNFVSIIDYKVLFNPNIFSLVNTQNSPAFPITLREPNSTAAGNMSESVNIGSDVTKAISTPTDVAILTFKIVSAPTNPTESISIDQAATRVFSVSSQDNADENVLSNTVPVQIAIAPDTNTPTPCPSGGCTTITPTPTTPVIANCGSATGRPDLCTCLTNGIVNQCANSCQAGLGNSSTEGYCCPSGQQYCKATNSCTSNPTACPDNGQTISLSFTLPGIGGSISGNNAHPLHPIRPVTIHIYDQYNQHVFSKENIPALFNGVEYKVTIPVTGLGGMSGLQVALSTDNSLMKKMSSLISVANPGNNVIPGSTMLVSGDIDHNNVVDLLDWNKLLGCHETQQPALGLGPCTAADLNDDGKIDEIDVNIFQRALAIREGDIVLNLFGSPTPTPLTVCPTTVPCAIGTHSVSDMPNPNSSCQTNHCAPNLVEVSISNSAFVSSTVTVESGTAVKWTNNDTIAHTVTADDGSFNSGTLQPGQSYTVMPPASVSYHCSIHPSMHGSISVVMQ